MLNSILNDSVSNINFLSVLICSICSIFLGVILALTHKYTSKYNKSFLVSISILPLLVEAIIIMVNGNLGTSIATLGAFGLVRFRSFPGTSKEILILFFAMTVGLSVGMGYIGFGFIITFLGSFFIILFNRIKIFNNTRERLLKVIVYDYLDYTSIFKEIFENYAKNVELEQIKTLDNGYYNELNYKLTLNKNVNEKEFIDKIREKNEGLQIILSYPVINSVEL